MHSLFIHNGSLFCVTDDYTPYSFFYISFFFAFLMGPTLSTFLARSLFEGGPIYNLSMCFHPMTTSRNFTNKSHCKYFVKKYSSICSVLQYAIYMLPLSTYYFTKQYCIYMCLQLPVHNLFPLFSISITLYYLGIVCFAW